MQRFFHFVNRSVNKLGPGFITGAADDDPSGIATYSIAGAQFGYKLLWMTLFITPLMIAIQEMCGRIGMVSGVGLAGAIRKYYSRNLLYVTVGLLCIANTINIGANLGAMSASIQMLFGLPFFFWLIVITIGTILMEIFIPYDRYAKYLKWMALTLLVYAATALVVTRDWVSVFSHVLIPHIQFNGPYLLMMVGFLGTTISPYLFFWQAGEEVEEAIQSGKINDFEQSPHVLASEIDLMRQDTKIGMMFSNIIAFFIILTTAGTLNVHGITEITTPQEAASALTPIAGDFSSLLFTIGIIGIGLQSVPILAGSLAYAVSESFGFKEGLAKKLTEAKAFYGAIAASTVIGALMNLAGINAISALYYAAIVNAVAAIPLIVIIIMLADDEHIVGKFKSTHRGKQLAWLTVFLMSASVLAMIYQLQSS